MGMDKVGVAGCGAVVMQGDAVLVNVYVGRDGLVEAFASDMAYTPLVREVVDSLEDIPDDWWEDGTVEEVLSFLEETVGTRLKVVEAACAACVFCDDCAAGDDEEDAAGEAPGPVRVRCETVGSHGQEGARFDEGDTCTAEGAGEKGPQAAEDGLHIDLHDRRALGAFGEELAARYLENRGFEVVGRNVRTAYGEADIVCRDGSELVLVEVKTRLGDNTFPEESIDRRKVERYRKMLLDYLSRQGSGAWARFDVIALNVVSDHVAHLRHWQRVERWDR